MANVSRKIKSAVMNNIVMKKQGSAFVIIGRRKMEIPAPTSAPRAKFTTLRLRSVLLVRRISILLIMSANSTAKMKI